MFGYKVNRFTSVTHAFETNLLGNQAGIFSLRSYIFGVAKPKSRLPTVTMAKAGPPTFKPRTTTKLKRQNVPNHPRRAEIVTFNPSFLTTKPFVITHFSWMKSRSANPACVTHNIFIETRRSTRFGDVYIVLSVRGFKSCLTFSLKNKRGKA